MKQWFISWLLIIFIGVTILPVAMVIAGIPVNRWLLLAGHLGGVLTGMAIIFFVMVERR